MNIYFRDKTDVYKYRYKDKVIIKEWFYEWESGILIKDKHTSYLIRLDDWSEVELHPDYFWLIDIKY